MRHHSTIVVALLLALLDAAAQGQELVLAPSAPPTASMETNDLQQEIAQLQSRLMALEKINQQTVQPAAFQPPAAPVDGRPVDAPVVDAQPSQNYFRTYRQSSGSWVGGASAFFLKPHWTGGNGAYVTNTTLPGGGINDQANFNSPFTTSPGFWFGYTGASGYGVQVNFFSYAQSFGVATLVPAGVNGVSDTSTGIAFAPPGNVFSASSFLNVNYWDIELTKRIQTRNWIWTGTAGLLYLYLGQGYDAVGVSATTTTRNTFNGLGPTASLGGRRPLGSLGFGVYGSGRGSINFGHQDYSVASIFLGNPVAVNTSKNWGVLPTAQLEFGLDYRRSLFGGRSTLVVENGMIGQAYFDAGGPDSNPGNSFFTTPITSTLGMYGMRSSLGITY